MTEVIEMQKSDLNVWRMAGKAFPGNELKDQVGQFLALEPREKFQDAQVYELPVKDLPGSVMDALFFLRSEGHAFYDSAPRDGSEPVFQIDRPIYELLIEWIIGLLEGFALSLSNGAGGPLRPSSAGNAAKPKRRGQTLIGYDGPGS